MTFVKCLLFLGIICLLLGGFIFIKGCSIIDNFIFFPEKTIASKPNVLGLNYQDKWIETKDHKKIHAWWIPKEPCKAVLLFCHGNAGNISHRLDNILKFNALGLSVLIFDYRGYGLSPGSPSEKGLEYDTKAAFVLAKTLAKQQNAKLVVFGRSLGGAAALTLFQEKGIDGMILESTFTNLSDMATTHYHIPFASKIVKGRFDSLSRIGQLTCPLLVIHGDKDDIVPYDLGVKLFEKATCPKEFMTIKNAGHNDTYLIGQEKYFTKITDFIENLENQAK